VLGDHEYVPTPPFPPVSVALKPLQITTDGPASAVGVVATVIAIELVPVFPPLSVNVTV